MTKLKRILIISYYWPPSGGPGVQRWLKFAKYLPQHGWQPVIVTPKNPHYKIRDETLLADVPPEAEVHRLPIWEPYGAMDRIRSMGQLLKRQKDAQSGSGGGTRKGKVASWVRYNLLRPDPKLFWIKPTRKFLLQYLRQHPVDVMVSTGPPHSMHLIALELKRQLGIPWITDIRDPWAAYDQLLNGGVTDWALQDYQRLEKTVLDETDILLGTSFSLPEKLQPFDHSKFVTITNGFDTVDIPAPPATAEQVDFFDIVYAGGMNENRHPRGFWEACRALLEENTILRQRLRVRIAGKIHPDIQQQVREDDLLRQHVHFLGYLPHEKIFDLYHSADLLLLLANDNDMGRVCIPGKLFEYLAMRKPILAITPPQSDVGRIIKSGQFGYVHPYGDAAGIRASMERVYTAGATAIDAAAPIRQYQRDQLTERLAGLLQQLTD